MPFVKFHKPYKFAHDGIRVEEFTPGDEPVETTDECAAQAIQDGAAKAVKAKAAAAPAGQAPASAAEVPAE